MNGITSLKGLAKQDCEPGNTVSDPKFRVCPKLGLPQMAISRWKLMINHISDKSSYEQSDLMGNNDNFLGTEHETRRLRIMATNKLRKVQDWM